MTDTRPTISNPYLNRLIEFMEGKSKGIKHSFREWSYKATEDDDGEGIEFLFELWSERSSRLTIWVWDNGSLCLDMRTYAKHDGWEFEHRVDGSLNERNFEELVSLIKGISNYYAQNALHELDKLVEKLAK